MFTSGLYQSWVRTSRPPTVLPVEPIDWEIRSGRRRAVFEAPSPQLAFPTMTAEVGTVRSPVHRRVLGFTNENSSLEETGLSSSVNGAAGSRFRRSTNLAAIRLSSSFRTDEHQRCSSLEISGLKEAQLLLEGFPSTTFIK